MKISKYLITLSVISFSLCARAQSNVTPSYVPTITPKAPDVAALMKFNDIPISPYTGTASVTVPIFTIKAKGVNIPISVDYHTGGIRLEEEASSTGLGWALNAGGMISRTINDKDDLNGDYFGTDVPQPQGDLSYYQPSNGTIQQSSSYPGSTGIEIDTSAVPGCPNCSHFENCLDCPIVGNRYMFNFLCSYNVFFKTGTYNYYEPFYSTSTFHDLEPDSYSFNFLGRSGKFIILKDKKTIVMEKQDNVNIQIVQPGTALSSIYFIITDESGNKYFFQQTQSTNAAWMTASSPTAWFLSKILTQQNDVITFNYLSATGYTYVASENTQTYEGLGSTIANPLINGSNIGTTYNNVVLSTIDYKDGQVKFFSDNARTDLKGGYKLDSISVYSKTTTGLTYVKTNKFYYSYFYSSPSGISYAPSGSSLLELQRLRLDSVQECSSAAALKPYKFDYNGVPGAFGEKHSYSIDHWGYYNGAGNTQLIPNMSLFYAGNKYDVLGTLFTYAGANRESSFPNSQAFSLRKVTYPTGGSSIFTYEANTYDYNKSLQKEAEYPHEVLVSLDTILNLNANTFSNIKTISGKIDFTKIFPIIPTSMAAGSNPNATITISFVSSYITGWPNADKATGGKLAFNFNGSNTDISDFNNPNLSADYSCNGPQCSHTYPLWISQASATAYTWTATYDSQFIPQTDFSEIHVIVSFKGLKRVVQNNPTLNAGGLRIKSVVDSTATGIAKVRNWNYHYGATGQYSNGLLMSFPSYARNELQKSPLGGEYPVLVLFSSSNTQTSSTIGGNIVGYSQVTETTIDPTNNADNGKIVYNFINTPDSVISYNSYRFPGIPNMGNNLNGSEISRITYQKKANAYWKLAETNNFYHTANRKIYYNAKYRSNQRDNPSGYCDLINASIPNRGLAEFFPSIKSERVLLDSTRSIVYDPADTTKFQVSTNKTYYDKPIHYLATRTKFVDSKGTTHVSKVTYPQDYISTGSFTGNAILDSLIGHNMIKENIEKRDSIYYSGNTTGYVSGATESRYKQLSTRVMVLDKMYKLDIVNPVTNFVPMSISGNTYNHDTRYRQLISFDNYDAYNNINQYTLTNQPPVAILWDYRGVSPIAQVKGAVLADIAYTSFEADGTGSWVIGSTVRDSLTKTITGTKSYNLASGNISKAGLTAANTYVVTYWTLNSSPLTIPGTITGYPIKGTTINGWTFYEHQVTGQTTITLSGTGNIDELRLYPNNAQMTSYTYNPLVGVTSMNDTKGGINFYEYDGFQRLMNIKDQNGNIIKHIDYHYQGQ